MFREIMKNFWIFVVCFTLWLIFTVLFGFKYPDFGAGVVVEVVGMVLEILVIYFIVDWQISKNEKKQLNPIHSSLMEVLVDTHIEVMTALKYMLETYSDMYKKDDKLAKIKLYEFRKSYFETGELKRKEGLLNSFISGMGIKLDTDTFITSFEYSVALNEIINFNNRSDQLFNLISNDEHKYAVYFRDNSLIKVEQNFNKLIKEFGYPKKPYFQSHYILSHYNNMPTSVSLIELLKTIKHVELESISPK
jgi:hypothetical protein